METTREWFLSVIVTAVVRTGLVEIYTDKDDYS
jgi:hypothetical protein